VFGNLEVFIAPAMKNFSRWKSLCTILAQGYLAHKKQPPPQDFHRALGIVLL